MRSHEQECVQRALGCSPDQLTAVNMSERLPTADELQSASAVLIGGSGAFHVYDEAAWVRRFVAFCGELLEAIDRPLLGMCFGHLALLMASGATVARDDAREELGTFTLTLTDEGRRDRLFADFPECFDVQLGHVDRAHDLPSGWVNLANSSSQPYEAVRRAGRPIWGSFSSTLSCVWKTTVPSSALRGSLRWPLATRSTISSGKHRLRRWVPN